MLVNILKISVDVNYLVCFKFFYGINGQSKSL